MAAMIRRRTGFGAMLVPGVRCWAHAAASGSRWIERGGRGIMATATGCNAGAAAQRPNPVGLRCGDAVGHRSDRVDDLQISRAGFSGRRRVAAIGRRLAWLIVGLAIDASAASDPPSVRRFGVEDGLSHNAVHALAQDADGFLWLGTQDGLDRFDGVEFRHVDHVAAGADDSPFVVALAVGADDRLWVGTRRGLGVLSPGARAPAAIALGANTGPRHIVALEVDGDTLWIGTERGLFRLDGAGRAAAPVAGAADLAVRAMTPAQDGGMWVLGGADACTLRLHRRDGTVQAAHPAPCGFGLASLADGRLGLGPQTHWDPSTPSAAAQGSLPWRVRRDGDQLLYAGLLGVEAAVPDQPSRALWPPDGRIRTRPLAAEVRSLLRDRDGALWLGTYDGLFQLDPKAARFAALGAGSAAEARLQALHVSALLPDGERLLIGSYGEGVHAWDEARQQLQRLHAGAECPTFVWSLVRDGAGVAVVNGECSVRGDRLLADRPAPVEPPPSAAAGDRIDDGPREVRAAVTDAAGTLWMTSVQGLWRERDGRVERVLDGHFEALAAAPGGSLWLAPNTDVDPLRVDRLLRYREAEGELQSVALPSREDIFDLLADGDGLWAATGAGLLHLDLAGELRHWQPTARGVGRVFYSLQRGSDGALWIGSSRGLLRFDPARSAAGFRQFDHRDGIANLEFNRRARWRDDTGRLWFGGMNGAVHFDPQHAVTGVVSSQVLIDAVRVLGPQGERALDPRSSAALELAHDDVGLTVSFVAPGFRRADRFDYRYRLLGLNPQWISGAGRRDARFTRLAPGEYRFEVAAGDDLDGERFGQAVLALSVPPPWHASGAFRLGVALLLVGFAWLVYRLRVAHLLALQRMRLGIASNLHDELGSELAAIAVGAGLVEQSPRLDLRERQRLGAIGQSAQAVSRALRDIVWVVNPDKDHLTDLLSRMRSFAAELLAEHELQFAGPAVGEERAIPMALRQDLYLLFKEAIGNVARHAAARRVEIGLRIAAGRLVLRIADDGVGFVPGEHPGTGLASMQRRAAALGGQLSIDSAPGQGCRLTLELPLTSMRRGWRRWRRG
jgi:signal transduction histidine kinase/streptogramin lyase